MSKTEADLMHDKRSGIEAKQALDNPKVREALMVIKAHWFEKFTKSSTSEERDEVWRQYKAVEDFERYLTRVIETGTMAEQKLFDKLKGKINGRKRLA